MTANDKFNVAAEFIAGIPVGFFYVLAACIALVGVWATLRGNSNRERDNRETEMRREVFLAAFEAIARAMSFVSEFGNVELPDDEHRKLIQSLQDHTTKIHLVGSMPVIRCLSDFDFRLSVAIGELSLERGRLMKTKRLLDFHRAQLNDFNSKMKEGLEAILRFSEADLIKFFYVQQGMTKFQAELEKTLSNEMIEVYKKAITNFADLEAKVLKLVVAVREDFGFDIAQSEYKSFMEEAISKIKETSLKHVDICREKWAADDAKASQTKDLPYTHPWIAILKLKAPKS